MDAERDREIDDPVFMGGAEERDETFETGQHDMVLSNPVARRGALPSLPLAREGELLAKAKEGDKGARAELVAVFLPMIRAIVGGKVAFHSESRDDLVQDGVVALLEAVDRFETRGIPFEHYVRVCVRRAVMEGMRILFNSIKLPRSVLHLIGKYEAGRAAYFARHGCTPSFSELTSALGFSERQVALMRRGLQLLSVHSLNEPLETKRQSRASELEIWQGLSDENAQTPEQIFIAQSFAQAVERSLRRLPPWERDVIMMRVDDGYHAALTYGEIARITCRTYREVRTASLLGMRKLARLRIGGTIGHP